MPISHLSNHPCMAWASYQIRKIAGCVCAGNAGNLFPRHWLQKKALVSDPGMHNGTCVTHVPWCMSGSLTRGGGENLPGIPGACTTRNCAYLTRGPWSKSVEASSDFQYLQLKYSILLNEIKEKTVSIAVTKKLYIPLSTKTQWPFH